MTEKPQPPKKPLSLEEAVYYRDLLRSARYAAQANAEDFNKICFAIESLGLRLANNQLSLGQYRPYIRWCAGFSSITTQLTETHPRFFSRFDALFESLLQARNDAMHSGAWARHATEHGVELCIGLEEAVMNTNKSRQDPRSLVRDHMVKTPISIEPWHPVALARQLMLMHSFSFLPTKIDDKWMLVSERAIVDFLYDQPDRSQRLAMSIGDATNNRLLTLVDARTVKMDTFIRDVLNGSRDGNSEFTLWLVVDDERTLVGVLSPFELM